MTIDHPDGVSPISISRADIKAPVDIQKQTINVKIDIVAQTLAKVEINIASSSVTLDINIAAAAAAVTLNVNVKSQTANINVNVAASAATVTVSVTGTANISITAQTMAVYSKLDWEVKEGNQKYLYGTDTLAALHTVSTLVQYTVPSGKTLYVYGLSFYAIASAEADANKGQYVGCYFKIAGSVAIPLGGNCGNGYSFAVPLKVTEDVLCYMNAWSGCDHSISVGGALLGFEV